MLIIGDGPIGFEAAENAFITLGFRSNVDLINMDAAGLWLNKQGTLDCNALVRHRWKPFMLLAMHKERNDP